MTLEGASLHAYPDAPSEPRSVRFRAERENDWAELGDLVERVLARGLRVLDADELRRLPVLYGAALSSLSVARQTALDRALIAYLDALATRAHLAIHGSVRRPGGILTLLVSSFPCAVRALAPELGVTTALFALGITVAFALVRIDSSWFFAFVDAGLAAGRTPAATTEALRAALYDRESGGSLATFASFLFTHNAKVGMMAFGLGAAAGVPAAALIFHNGLMLGAIASLYADRGLLVPLLGWILPHGVPELTAMLLCGAAGLALGRAMLFPGARPARQALLLAGRRAATVVAGSVVLFAVAGLFEGFFRQLVTSDAIRFAVAGFNALWVGAWLLLGGRGREEEELP
jgi:uncharacterized membrane protein SpoIIM required for sporulation